MEFGILKCAVESLQKEFNEIQLPNGEKICETDVGGYKYLCVLELDKYKYVTK